MGPPDPRESRAALAAPGVRGRRSARSGGAGARTTGADLVIAADSGLAHARALGVHVDLVIGDLDSVDPAALDARGGRGHGRGATPRSP